MMSASNQFRLLRTIPLAIGILFATSSALLVTGCNEAEKAGEVVKEAANEAGEKVSEAGEKISDGFSDAVETASAALKDIDGGSEILTKAKDVFASAQTTLKGITDKASAEAAMAKLGDLDGAIDSLGELTGKLPETAKTALGGVIDQGVEQLKALFDKMKDMPGVSDVIKPRMDALIEKLSGMIGS